jgi:hypothetical protein
MAAAVGELGSLAYELAGEILGSFGLESDKVALSERLASSIRARLIAGSSIISAINDAFQTHSQEPNAIIPNHIFDRFGLNQNRYGVGSLELENATNNYLRSRGISLNDELRYEVRQFIMDSQQIDPNLIDAAIRRNRARESDAAASAAQSQRNAEVARQVERNSLTGRRPILDQLGENTPLLQPQNENDFKDNENLANQAINNAATRAREIQVERMPRPIRNRPHSIVGGLGGAGLGLGTAGAIAALMHRYGRRPLNIEPDTTIPDTTIPDTTIPDTTNPPDIPIMDSLPRPIRKPNINPTDSPLLGTNDFIKVPNNISNNSSAIIGNWIPPRKGTYTLNRYQQITRGDAARLLNS